MRTRESWDFRDQKMKFCKKYQEYMQGQEKKLPGVGFKKLKKILKKCRRDFQSQKHLDVHHTCPQPCPGSGFFLVSFSNSNFLSDSWLIISFSFLVLSSFVLLMIFISDLRIHFGDCWGIWRNLRPGFCFIFTRMFICVRVCVCVYIESKFLWVIFAVCDGTFFPSLLKEMSDVVGCFNQRAQKLLDLHLASGVKKYLIWFRGKLQRSHVALIQEGNDLVTYALINATAIRKILKKYDKVIFTHHGNSHKNFSFDDS